MFAHVNRSFSLPLCVFYHTLITEFALMINNCCCFTSNNVSLSLSLCLRCCSQYLTQLEVSENEMEVLDLSSLAQLETLKCSHNKLLELMINGSNLTSLVADFNCKYNIYCRKYLHMHACIHLLTLNTFNEKFKELELEREVLLAYQFKNR